MNFQDCGNRSMLGIIVWYIVAGDICNGRVIKHAIVNGERCLGIDIGYDQIRVLKTEETYKTREEVLKVQRAERLAKEKAEAVRKVEEARKELQTINARINNDR